MEPALDSDPLPGADRRPRRWRLRIAVLLVAAALVAFGAGFLRFMADLEINEEQPRVRADGIVVLTGGSSRITDAMELLAGGYGRRLLISGVHWANGTTDISRSLPDNQALLRCCVDLDRSAVNTRSNAVETRRWVREQGFASLIVVTSNYHMPRALVELSHAMPGVRLTPFPVIGDKWRDEPWWTSGAAARLLITEYVKYLAAGVRVRVDDVLPRGDERGEPKSAPRPLGKPTAAATQ